MIFETTQEAVEAAAMCFDEHEPGWYDRIDLDKLQMSNPAKCVVGQIYREHFDMPFNDGIAKLAGLLGARRGAVLFDSLSGDSAFGCSAEAERCWEIQIIRRRIDAQSRRATDPVVIRDEVLA